MATNWKQEKETLQQLLNEKISYLEIGRRYGVSGNAVKKAIKRLGLSIEPRRNINPNETFGKGRNDVTETCIQCGKEFSHPKHLGIKRFCSKECKENYKEYDENFSYKLKDGEKVELIKYKGKRRKENY